MGATKYIYFFFACACLLLAFLLSLTIEWVWGYFGRPQDLIVSGAALGGAVLTTFVVLKTTSVYSAISGVLAELQKVTWPTRKETSSATVVVMVTVAVASLILSMFDAVWSFLTNRILS